MDRREQAQPLLMAAAISFAAAGAASIWDVAFRGGVLAGGALWQAVLPGFLASLCFAFLPATGNLRKLSASVRHRHLRSVVHRAPRPTGQLCPRALLAWPRPCSDRALGLAATGDRGDLATPAVHRRSRLPLRHADARPARITELDLADRAPAAGGRLRCRELPSAQPFTVDRVHRGPWSSTSPAS